ncbi:LysE family translocator [Reinekea marinisedimentorum]|uniref:Threonine/homoserine/homoserine lactone efflux protein n=1 Tax=Reinekea marinisedimentorum TaxID=230495 RepID=A0A4R3HST3_9GAMM|nr:LysE family translocator [Reinekea marinisedimentorum]TCS35201.1 threonine/homoserine/homoserine lactone efflux protein [Reinekea marinisedimentorum]
MVEYINALLLTYTAFIFAVLSPGPNVFGVMNISLEKGKAAGLLFGLGIAFGSLTWATLSVLGLTQIIAKYAELLFLIKVFGGVYLIHLAIKAYKSSKTEIPSNSSKTHDLLSKQYFAGGYTLMMTNPKAALAWVAIVSLSTFNNAPAWVSIAAITGTFSLSVIIHVAYASIFSSRPFVRYYRKSRSKILKVFSIVYGGLGMKLLSTTN